MPTVKQLIENLNQDKKPVVTTAVNETLAVALNKMLEHDFTQLPFLDDDKYYFLTTASILVALSAYGGTITGSKLEVINAKVDVTATYTEDDDIFEVMKEVERSGAALIVDETGIKNIITAYDTAVYFQQWSEDTMHVREIERELKDIINLTFKDQEGNIDIVERKAAVDLVSAHFTYSKEQLVKGLKAIHHIYLPTKVTINSEAFRDCFKKVLIPQAQIDSSAEDNSTGIKVDEVTIGEIKTSIENYIRTIFKEELPAEDILKRAFPDIFADSRTIEFDDLTLAQYIQIILGPSWDKCRTAFKLDKERISFILEGIRETRNKLAHFHEENITPQDRAQLRLCNDLLQKTKRDISTSWQ